MYRKLLAVAGVAAVALVALPARPEAPGAAPTGAEPLFTISKSENKNQVQFAVRVDERCAPEGNAPVHAYWRMLERGNAATEPLLPREEPAYGVASQAVIERGDTSGTVRLTLHALRERELLVRTWPSERGCSARVDVAIAGVAAYLFNVHAQLRWPFGIDHLVVSGHATDDGHVVHETIRR